MLLRTSTLAFYLLVQLDLFNLQVSNMEQEQLATLKKQSPQSFDQQHKRKVPVGAFMSSMDRHNLMDTRKSMQVSLSSYSFFARVITTHWTVFPKKKELTNSANGVLNNSQE